MFAPAIRLFADAAGELNYLGILASGDQPLVSRQAQQQLGNLQPFDQRQDVIVFIACAVGTEDEYQNGNALLAELCANQCLKVAGHILGEIHDGIEKVVGRFVYRQVGMESHAAGNLIIK